jgi:hypothetical protein
MSDTKMTNGTTFITWKRVAIIGFAIIGALIVFGGNAMVTVANSHVTASEAPALIRGILQPLTDQVMVNGNRISILETDKANMREQLARIEKKLDEVLDRTR